MIHHHNAHSRLQLSDNRLRSPFSRIHIVFDGCLSLWRQSVNLDVLLVLHEEFNSLEIATFNSITGQESIRLYVNMQNVIRKLNFAAYNASVAIKQDEHRRGRRHFDKAIIERDATFSLVTKYLLSRLAVYREGSDNSQAYTVYLKPQLGDVILANSVTCAIDGVCPSGVMLDSLMAKPESLKPISTTHFKRRYVNFLWLTL